MKTLPYVYKITHKENNQFYIGVRWGNKHPAENDLGKHYKTSSKLVKEKFDEFDYEIIAEFFDSEDAIDFEQKTIEENWGNPLLLNKAIQVSKTFRCSGHTEETKKKMSNSKKGKPPNNKGKKLSAATKEKISKSSKERTHTEESKEKMRLKAIGNKRGIGNKSRLGQTQSVEEREKKSKALKGNKNPNYGKPMPDWQKEKIRAARLSRPKIECPHCNRLILDLSYSKWHGDKCKSRNNFQGSSTSTTEL